MTDYIRIIFQFLPAPVAIAFLGLFTVLVILIGAKIVKIILDALPFV